MLVLVVLIAGQNVTRQVLPSSPIGPHHPMNEHGTIRHSSPMARSEKVMPWEGVGLGEKRGYAETYEMERSMAQRGATRIEVHAAA